MKNKKSDTRCCGKELNNGDLAYNRFGVLMCKDCDEKNPPPFMGVYEFGNLKTDHHFCGEHINVQV
jgi:hypothetical protein